jgi:hypothetical protein
MICPAQYDKHGVVKEFRHPDRLRILRLKSSYADVVRPVFLNEYVSCSDSVGVTWCLQRSSVCHGNVQGGRPATSRLHSIDCSLNDLSDAANFTGIHQGHGSIQK